ncbi:hypothetical protein HY570_02330 [Candidatus Micrarchaeota archaeon]|nr:hypothetical protein [Candidatus Micrarchaeota archaeon]
MEKSKILVMGLGSILLLILIIVTLLPKPTQQIEEIKVNCTETTQYFLSELPNSFKSFGEGLKWCNECVNKSGIPSRGLDTVFCNYRTKDSGKPCTDSTQCEGKCRGEDENSKIGQCSSKLIDIGCNYEFFNGESLNVCYD